MNRKEFFKILGLSTLINKVFPAKGMDLYKNKENKLPKQLEVKLEKFIINTIKGGNSIAIGHFYFKDGK